jgi:hypothetical protein
MPIERLVSAATSLASSVGPRSTLQAMQELEAALADIDTELGPVEPAGGDDLTEIDLREARAVLAELPQLLAAVDVRIADLQSAMAGR